IDIDKSREPARAESINQAIQLPASSAFVEDRKNRAGQLPKLFFSLFACFASRFVDDLQNFFPPFGRKVLLLQEIGPEFAVADSNDEIFLSEPESAQDVDAKRDQLDVGREVAFADDIAIQLIMFAQPTTLLFFVTEELTDRKPFERFLECALVLRDH